MNSVFAQTVVGQIIGDGSVCSVAFRSDGTVTGAIGANLLGFDAHTGEFREDGSKSQPSNLFDECSIFTGMEDDIGDLVDAGGGQLAMPSVVLEGSNHSNALDFRVSRHDIAEFLLVATRTDLDGPFHFQRLRKNRSDAYEDELLSQERARFEVVYRNNPVISFAVDHFRKVLGWSNEAYEFATCGRGGSMEAWIEGYLQARYDVGADDTPLRATNRSHELTTAVRGDGSIRIIDASVYSVEYKISAKLEYYFVLRDVTEQEISLRSVMRSNAEPKKLTATLTVSNERLETSARLAAHDLVAPVGRMAAFSELLAGKLRGNITDKDAEFYLEAIVKSARSSTSIFHDILELSKFDGSEMAIEECHSKPIIAEIASEDVNADDSNTFECFTFENDIPPILADRRYLRLILRNLIGNSSKYRSPDRSLSVDVKFELDDSGFGVLSLKDNSIGLIPRRQRVYSTPLSVCTTRAVSKGPDLGFQWFAQPSNPWDGPSRLRLFPMRGLQFGYGVLNWPGFEWRKKPPLKQDEFLNPKLKVLAYCDLENIPSYRTP